MTAVKQMGVKSLVIHKGFAPLFIEKDNELSWWNYFRKYYFSLIYNI